MANLFDSLEHAAQGAPAIALSAAFLWGVLSVVLSPCHLASIPLIVAFINGQGRISTKRLLISSLFSAGILITLGVIGGITHLAGQMVGNLGPAANYVVAAVFFLIGLHLLGVIPLPFRGPQATGIRRKGPLAAFLLGLVFGIALGPCTFAYMAPILSISFLAANRTAANTAYGVLLLGSYGIGHCSVILLAGTSTELIQRYLNWNEKSKGAVILKRICGVLLLLGGAYMIYAA